MIYRGDIEKKIVDGEAHYRPIVWVNQSPRMFSSEPTEETE
jgi:hypothetical protein